MKKGDDTKKLYDVYDNPADKTRSEVVDSSFLPFIGVHEELENAIKPSMNDPDSYQHVQSRYQDNTTTIYVITTFRGKNSFGGIITSQAEATLDGNTGKLNNWNMLPK